MAERRHPVNFELGTYNGDISYHARLQRMAVIFPRNTARSDDNHIDDIQKDEVVHIVIDIPSTRRRQVEERQIVRKSRPISQLLPIKA